MNRPVILYRPPSYRAMLPPCGEPGPVIASMRSQLPPLPILPARNNSESHPPPHRWNFAALNEAGEPFRSVDLPRILVPAGGRADRGAALTFRDCRPLEPFRPAGTL